MASTLLALFRRLAAEDHGQDLVEYALLAGYIALAGYVVIYGAPGQAGLRDVMRTTYTSWNTAMLDLWQMPAPP